MYTSLIVATDSKYGISKSNNIPWQIKEDTQFFIDVTKRVYGPADKNILIMGRKTWESYNQYSKKDKTENRTVIVVSSTLISQEAYVVKTLSDAIGLTCVLNCDHVFICGGLNIYKDAIHTITNINQIYLTTIDYDYECDNCFNNEFQDYITNNYNLHTDDTFLLFDGQKDVNVSFKKYYKQEKPVYWEQTEEHQYLTLLKDVLKYGDYSVKQ
jgi:dihydrofolate reductase